MKCRLLPLLMAMLVLLSCGKQGDGPVQERMAKPPEASSVPAGTEETAPPVRETLETEPQPETFVLTFGGDCTFGGQPNTLQAPPGLLENGGG